MTFTKRFVRRVVGQFGRPRGLSGYVAGCIMALRPSNRRRNQWVVSLLDVQPAERVLEIGFGPGIAIKALGRIATKGLVYGVDHSEIMLRQATKRNSAAIRAGRVRLSCGSVSSLPSFDEPLDAIMAVNSMGFWPDPRTRLKELWGRLRNGGRIAIASQPRLPGATKETAEQHAREIEAMLAEAGFARIRVEMLPLAPPVVCVLGVKTE